MKKEYPRFVRYEIEKFFNGLSQEEKDDIDKYIDYCKISVGDGKASDMRRSVIQFRYIIEKPLSVTTLDDLRGFLSLLNHSKREKYTTNGIKVHIRKYLRWKFKDWSVRFDEFSDVRLQNGFNEKKLNGGTLLKPEDIEKIMKQENNILKKCFFIGLYESGARVGEWRTATWNKVKLYTDGDISTISIYSPKTKRSRNVLVKECSFYLSKLKETSKSKYIFPSVENSNEPLTKTTAHRWVSEMCEAVGIKNVYPYVLRHSRAHHLYSNLPSKIAQRFLGHGKDMSDFYDHIESKDVKESMLKIVYNFNDIPQERKHELEVKMDNVDKLMVMQGELQNLTQEVLFKVANGEKVNSEMLQKVMTLRSKMDTFKKSVGFKVSKENINTMEENK